jgi:hypoxanthine phosphoribosyltransferase
MHDMNSRPVEVAGPVDTGPYGDVESVLIQHEAIQGRVQQLGREIAADYHEKFPVVVGVMKGSFIFLADLVRLLDMPVNLDFIRVRSFSGGSRTGEAVVIHDLDTDIRGRHVLLVEDIVDTGQTARHLMNLLHTREPASVELCTLLEKRNAFDHEVELKYVGFRIPDVFVVGYGLDYNGSYRNLPYIGILNETQC